MEDVMQPGPEAQPEPTCTCTWPSGKCSCTRQPEPLSAVERRRLAASILCLGCANGYELYDDEREGYPCHRTGTVIVEVFGCTGMAEAEEEDMQRAVALIAAHDEQSREDERRKVVAEAKALSCGCYCTSGPHIHIGELRDLLPSPPTEEKGR
jgi:hypothetical protein